MKELYDILAARQRGLCRYKVSIFSVLHNVFIHGNCVLLPNGPTGWLLPRFTP